MLNNRKINSSQIRTTENGINGSSKQISSRNSHSAISRFNAVMNSSNCRRLLEKVDRMREILQTEKVFLPQIVVVGDQSAGKSSILESISGVELPRAQNICTRCPLELRLKHAPSNTAEYATIRCEGVPEIRIDNLSEISARVIECTRYLTGDDVNVSEKAILLTVYKQEIENDLTLIDLPGITRAQTEGQSPAMYQKIISLIEMCVKHESSVVLHVILASNDFTTSESIRICQRYDPRFERQMIAVSKIDKYDKGIGKKLQGLGHGLISHSLGCVAVLNRSQEEIDAKVSFAEMKRREEEFFRTNEEFADVPEEYLGSQALIKKLVSIQQERIRSTLPQIIDQLEQKKRLAEEELKRIPSVIASENQARTAFNDILRNYRIAVEKRARGDYEIHIEKHSQTFNPEASEKWDDRIAYHLKMFGECTSTAIRTILSEFSHGNPNIDRSIADNYGGGLPNFPSTNIIQQLYQPYHRKLEEPCKKLIEWVNEYINRCLQYILDKVIPDQANFKAALSLQVTKTIRTVISKSKEKCLSAVEQMLAMEEKVFTVNPKYMEAYSKLRSQIPTSNSSANDVLLGLQAYCSVVHARIVDHLFQLCEYWFIRNGVLIIDSHLQTAFTPAELLKIMKDLPALEQKRTSLRRTIDIMDQALAAAIEE